MLLRQEARRFACESSAGKLRVFDGVQNFVENFVVRQLDGRVYFDAAPAEAVTRYSHLGYLFSRECDNDEQ